MYKVNVYLHGIAHAESFSEFGQLKIINEACSIQRQEGSKSFREIAENLCYMYWVTKEVR